MKISLGLMLIIGAFVASIAAVFTAYRADIHYTRQYQYHWELADRASTIDGKQKEINAFVNELENGYRNRQFAEYNATIFETPLNSFSNNLVAVKTLQTRLLEIKDMKPNSFEYQTAIQQITAQEQGQAHEMLDIFEGCWRLQNYWLLWDWHGTVLIVALILVAIIGFILCQ